jgi:CO dehydrogenase nickel-insertion accessory protein CooC1
VVKRQSVLINQVPDGISPEVAGEMSRLGIEATAIIPLDDEVYQYDIKLKPLLELPDSSKAVQAVNNLMVNLLGVKEGK